MKLEIGMYVRSKINGMIGKITDIEETKVFDSYLTVIREETRYILDNNFNKGFCETEKDSVEASHNIIDLIEVGDYVNGYKIVAIEQDYFNGKLVLITEKWETNWQGDRSLVMFHNEDICSVLTKEQYEKMSYKVGE